MAIIGALPVNLANGTTADATQVMSNFNSIVSQVNAGAAQISGGNAFIGTQTIGGDTILTAAASQAVSGKTFTGPNGSIGAPTYSFSASTNTGMFSPGTNTLAFSTNNISAITLDANQNVGVGITPSPWSSGHAVEVSSLGNALWVNNPNSLQLISNGYFNSGFKFASANTATMYAQSAGTHTFYTTASGTVGAAITFTAVLSLAANGAATFSAGATFGGSISATGLAITGVSTFVGSATTTRFVIGSQPTFTVDWSKSNYQTMTLTGNVASGGWSFTNSADGQTLNLKITQDGTGNRTFANNSAIKWPGGVVGTLSTAAGAVDIMTMTFDAGTGFYYTTLLKGFA